MTKKPLSLNTCYLVKDKKLFCPSRESFHEGLPAQAGGNLKIPYQVGDNGGEISHLPNHFLLLEDKTF